jgi:hypothetical protein
MRSCYKSPAPRGPGGGPDSLGVPGMIHAQEFSQSAPRISGSAQCPGRTRSPAAPGPGPGEAVSLAEPLPGALGGAQTAWVCRGWPGPGPGEAVSLAEPLPGALGGGQTAWVCRG